MSSFGEPGPGPSLRYEFIVDGENKIHSVINPIITRVEGNFDCQIPYHSTVFFCGPQRWLLTGVVVYVLEGHGRGRRFTPNFIEEWFECPL